MLKLDRWVGSCNILNDLSNKICVPNETEDLNLNMFNIIARINESKTLKKHISSECKCRFGGKNVIQINSGIMICQCECRRRHVCEKDYVWNLATFGCENGKYLASIWMIQ